ncbi:MAG TPA: response regulator, partial [Elusimicrobiota bacterium]|nr:response regulator [Elusimicrobiota bacterium]
MANASGVVLVVEDDAAIRDIMKEELESQGLTVLGASSGEESLVLLETRPVDVVIMDLRMPGMDGIETSLTIKGRFPALPIILCTVCDEWEVRSFIGREIQSYLPKPFTLRQLNETVQTA